MCFCDSLLLIIDSTTDIWYSFAFIKYELTEKISHQYVSQHEPYSVTGSKLREESDEVFDTNMD